MWIPPPDPLGSGNFGTPCERMQSANLTPADTLAPEVLLGWPEEPQAASASAEQAATAIAMTRISRALYRLFGYTGVTLRAPRVVSCAAVYFAAVESTFVPVALSFGVILAPNADSITVTAHPAGCARARSPIVQRDDPTLRWASTASSSRV